jgi:hypothetical protein
VRCSEHDHKGEIDEMKKQRIWKAKEAEPSVSFELNLIVHEPSICCATTVCIASGDLHGVDAGSMLELESVPREQAQALLRTIIEQLMRHVMEHERETLCTC